MYEYQPKLLKRKEKMLSLFLGVAGVGVYLGSLVKGAPYPAVFQLTAVLLLVATIALVGRYLLRNFCYTVAPRRDAAADAPYDLTVTEIYGRRRSVVCILSIAEIKSATPCIPENKEKLKMLTAGATIYRYVASIWEGEAWMLEIEHEEQRFFLKISANSELISAISQ